MDEVDGSAEDMILEKRNDDGREESDFGGEPSLLDV
jgi:hypothetical protein